MTLAPNLEDSAKAAVIQYIDLALDYLAAWCPHGFDSARVMDYHTADDVRRLLEEALIHLGVHHPPVAPPISEPPYAELWRRIESADETACNGGFQDSDCPWCKTVVETLRGGSIFCPKCGHIGALGHSCEDWRQYDKGEIDLAEVTRRTQARDATRFPRED